jgi:hypothetical protein
MGRDHRAELFVHCQLSKEPDTPPSANTRPAGIMYRISALEALLVVGSKCAGSLSWFNLMGPDLPTLRLAGFAGQGDAEGDL